MPRRRFVLVLVATLIACAPAARAQPPWSGPADPGLGAELFRTRGCRECHAADVERLRAQDRSLYALAATMWNHTPRMAAQVRASMLSRPYLTSTEMRDLFAFLSSGDPAERGRTELRWPGSAGDPARGQRLLRTKGCLGCHSLSPGGGLHAGNLADLKGWDTPWSVIAQMWNHIFLMELETQRQGVGWTQLTADEMADVVAYLQSLMRAQ